MGKVRSYLLVAMFAVLISVSGCGNRTPAASNPEAGGNFVTATHTFATGTTTGRMVASPTPKIFPSPSATPTALPTVAPTATHTPFHVPSPLPTSTATPVIPVLDKKATNTPGVAATPLPTPLAPGKPWPTPDVSRAKAHYWLQRPLWPPARCIASAFYPYGTNGMGAYLVHHGADFQAKYGTPIHATGDGVIVVAGSDREHVYGKFRNFYGNLVVEKLDREYEGRTVFVLFGHLSKVECAPGQRVKAGDVVGMVGSAGIAMGPHLHLEVRVGKNDYSHTRNPEFWLKLLPGRGTLVGRLLTPDGRDWPGAVLTVRKRGGHGKAYQILYTYLDDPQIHPDDQWGENFLWADAPAGSYRLETPWGKVIPFTIEAGGTTFLDLRQEELSTSGKAPVASPNPSSTPGPG